MRGGQTRSRDGETRRLSVDTIVATRRLRPLTANRAKTCRLVDYAARYVGKGIADGAYRKTVGGDRVPEEVLDDLERFLKRHCRGVKR